MSHHVRRHGMATALAALALTQAFVLGYRGAHGARASPTWLQVGDTLVGIQARGPGGSRVLSDGPMVLLAFDSQCSPCLAVGPAWTAWIRELGLDWHIVAVSSDPARASRARFAESQPGATDIRCQPGGVAWLQQFSTLTDPLGRGQSWRMVSMQGEVRDHAFPSDFTPMVFTNRGAYGILEGPDGYQQLAWWEGILLP